MNSTEVIRLDLVNTPDLRQVIINSSDAMLNGGFKLVSTFVLGDQLVLIYQRIS